MNQQRIKANLSLFNQNFIEVRLLKTNKGTVSGYYDRDHFDKLLKDIRQYDGVNNIFFTLNPLDDNITARSRNHLTIWAKHTTTDSEITKRKWILIDLDPVRPSGVSSTDEELSKAEQMASKVTSFLAKEGFPECIHAMSGNGHHLLLPVDLPNTPEVTKMVKDFLFVLDSKFSDEEVKVDTSTFNASRITKLYGTMACKGDNTSDRPHRRSYIIFVPEKAEPVSKEQLEKTISEWGVFAKDNNKTSDRKEKPRKKTKKQSKKINVKEFCKNHGIEISREKKYDNDGICYVLSTCPWNPEHKDKSSYIIEFPNGKIVAGCHHDSCNEETWETLLKKFPDTANFTGSFKDDTEDKASRAEILLYDIKEAGHLFFHDNGENAYVSIPLENGREYVKLRDKRYSQALRQMYYEKHRKPLSKDNIQQVLDTLEADAIFNGEKIEPALRCKLYEGKVYYHLADKEQTVLCIDGEGIHVLTGDCPIPFVKTKDMLPQVMPEDIEVAEGEKKPSFRKIAKKYWKFRSEDDFLLHNVILLTRLISDIPAPVIYYIGDRGSAKTTSMRMDKLFIDPSEVDVKAMPVNINDIVTTLSDEYMVGYDNLEGSISHEMSNLLCICCSCGYYSKRKLFTDNEKVNVKLNSRLSFSGITTITDRADFLDRCICLSCERIVPSERRTVDEILTQFKTELPYLLYQGMKIVSKAIKMYETLEIAELPRMADFALWGYAIAEVMNYGGEHFLEVYQKNQNELLEVMVEEDSLLTVLISFAEKEEYFIGSMTQLYDVLTKEAQTMKVNTSYGWCKSLNSLSRKLFQSQSVLEQFDIHLQRGKSNGKRYVEVWKGEKTNVQDLF